MDNFFGFLVKRRVFVLIVTLILALVCGVMMLYVGLNSDLTKYLPDDSEMFRGMELMEEHFPGDESYTIRVMLKNLSEDEKDSIRETLSQIDIVDSVEYAPDSIDYNKDGGALFALNTSFDYAPMRKRKLRRTSPLYSTDTTSQSTMTA